ncbi:MAG: aquaporin [Elusimicrobiota bacterium]
MAGNLRAFLAELLGTFAWVLFAAGAVCTDAALGGRIGPLGIAAAQGLAIAAVFGLFGRYSPGMFNPAFTLALAAIKRLDRVKAVLCLVCQLLGATLAGLLLAKLFAHYPIIEEPPFLGTPMAAGLGFRGATMLEAVLTFFLALAARRAWGDPDHGARGAAILVVGATAFAATLLGGPLSGAALNPAHAFGPAVASGYWTQHYVYWVGPLAGAIAGLSLSEFMFEK